MPAPWRAFRGRWTRNGGRPVLQTDQIGRYDDPMHSRSLLGLGVASHVLGVGFAQLRRHAIRRQNRARRSLKSRQARRKGLGASSSTAEVRLGAAEALSRQEGTSQWDSGALQKSAPRAAVAVSVSRAPPGHRSDGCSGDSDAAGQGTQGPDALAAQQMGARGWWTQGETKCHQGAAAAGGRRRGRCGEGASR